MSAPRAGRRSGPASTNGPARSERILAAERRIGYVAHALDDLVAIPGTKSRIGLDPIIGLIPFVGDLVTSLVAMWIVLEAARFHLPGIVLVRMILNATFDFFFGLVPFLGDLFDFGFKANTRNLELFHQHAVDPGADTSGSWTFVAGIAAIFIALIWLSLQLLGRLLAAIFGG